MCACMVSCFLPLRMRSGAQSRQCGVCVWSLALATISQPRRPYSLLRHLSPMGRSRPPYEQRNPGAPLRCGDGVSLCGLSCWCVAHSCMRVLSPCLHCVYFMRKFASVNLNHNSFSMHRYCCCCNLHQFEFS